MQISNNMQSPNFGMALRIKSSALDSLKDMSRSDVEKLQKAGEALKDTKYYHLLIGENGERTVVSPFANKYKGGSFSVKEPTDEFLKFDAIWAGTESGNLKPGDAYSGAIKFSNKEAAQKAYKDISQTCSYGPEKDVKMIKYLDAREIEKDAEAKTIQEEKNAIANMVDDLFAKYPAE